MTTYESPVRDGAIERPGSLSSPNSNADNTRRRLELGERAGKYLDGMCDAIASDRVELWQLPLPIASLYLLGYEQGRASRHDEISRLNWEADFWYWRLANPRLDWHRNAESELWRQGSSVAS